MDAVTATEDQVQPPGTPLRVLGILPSESPALRPPADPTPSSGGEAVIPPISWPRLPSPMSPCPVVSPWGQLTEKRCCGWAVGRCSAWKPPPPAHPSALAAGLGRSGRGLGSRAGHTQSRARCCLGGKRGRQWVGRPACSQGHAWTSGSGH